MNVQATRSVSGARRLLPFERIALVLQGGGALGAYQAGVYDALAESGVEPDGDATTAQCSAAPPTPPAPSRTSDAARCGYTSRTSISPRQQKGGRGQMSPAG